MLMLNHHRRPLLMLNHHLPLLTLTLTLTLSHRLCLLTRSHLPLPTLHHRLLSLTPNTLSLLSKPRPRRRCSQGRPLVSNGAIPYPLRRCPALRRGKSARSI